MPRPSSRDAILETAVQIASVQGLEGLSIGGLAVATQKSKGGICAHFPSKADLQLAVVGRAAELFKQAVIVPTLRESPGLARLERMIDAWFQYIQEGVFTGGCFFTNAALELDDLEASNEVLSEVRKLYGDYLRFLERCIRDAITEGSVDPETDVELLAYELHGLEAAALVRHALGESEAYATAARHARALLDRHRSRPKT